jgi:polyphosphate kinase 2 (PPK2 family)
MRERLDQKPVKVKEDRIPPVPPAIDRKNIVRSLDLRLKLERKKYEELLDEQWARLNLLSRHRAFKSALSSWCSKATMLPAKAGAIRRVTRALDARQYRIVSVAGPTEEERAQPYLWRFWRHVPRRGRFTFSTAPGMGGCWLSG